MGYFDQPAVLANVTGDMANAHAEIFGPVIPVLAHEDADELTERAYDSTYGLAASVWTKDLANAYRPAAQGAGRGRFG